MDFPKEFANQVLLPIARYAGAAFIGIAAITLIGYLVDKTTGKPTPPSSPKPYQTTPSVIAVAPAPAPTPAPPTTPSDDMFADLVPVPDLSKSSHPNATGAFYVHPDSAPNGNPWPARAGYVQGYPIDNDSGYSKVTVDNSQNDTDVFVKLVSLEDSVSYPVRQFYIPAHSQFTMNKVTPGKYDIRYRSLDNGNLSRSEAFEAEERDVADGIEYSTNVLTLYKVENGNMQTYPLTESEF